MHHLFWTNGELTIHGLTILLTGLLSLVSVILLRIGYQTNPRSAWAVGMMAMSLVCLLLPCILLFPHILSLLDSAISTILVLAALAILTGLFVLSIMTRLWAHLNH